MPGSWLHYVHYLTESPKQPCEADIIFLSILQMSELRLREDKNLSKRLRVSPEAQTYPYLLLLFPPIIVSLKKTFCLFLTLNITNVIYNFCPF